MKKLLSLVISVIAVLNINMNVFAENDISAKSCIVIDALSGDVIYSHNAEEKLPMASTTKIMSVMLALEQDNIDEEFVVDSDAIKVEGSSMGLSEGDKVTLRTLCYGMLLPSGNDAANAAAVKIAGDSQKFVDMMNERANKIGLENTHFVTPSGLDDDTDEHYSTAFDMAKLTREAMKNKTFCEICSKKNFQIEFGDPPCSRLLTNTNKLLSVCDGVCGVKTGFTDKAKRCLVSACERNGGKLICVTLNDPDDWKDHEMLYDNCFEKLKKINLSNNFDIAAVGGVYDKISCKSEPVNISMSEKSMNKIEQKIYMMPFVYCPIAENEQVGRIEYYFDDELIAETAIKTAEYCES